MKVGCRWVDVKGLYSVGALFLARTSPHRAVPSLPMLASCPWSTGSCLSSTGQRPASPSWPARPYLRSPAADSCSPRTTACLWSGPGKASWPNPSSKTPRPCRGSIRRRFHETAEDDEAAGLYSARTPFARPNGVPPERVKPGGCTQPDIADREHGQLATLLDSPGGRVSGVERSQDLSASNCSVKPWKNGRSPSSP